MSLLPPVDNRPGYIDRIRWQRVTNASGMVIPPGSLVKITGTDESDDEGRFNVTRPNADSLPYLLVTGPMPIPIGSTGLATYDDPVPIAYNSAVAPATGQTWGSAANSFQLTSGKSGYQIVSDASGYGVVLAMRAPAASSAAPLKTQNTDASSVIASTAEIDADKSTGIGFTASGTKNTLACIPASPTQQGVVTTAFQQLKGTKQIFANGSDPAGIVIEGDPSQISGAGALGYGVGTALSSGGLQIGTLHSGPIWSFGSPFQNYNVVDVDSGCIAGVSYVVSPLPTGATGDQSYRKAWFVSGVNDNLRGGGGYIGTFGAVTTFTNLSASGLYNTNTNQGRNTGPSFGSFAQGCYAEYVGFDFGSVHNDHSSAIKFGAAVGPKWAGGGSDVNLPTLGSGPLIGPHAGWQIENESMYPADNQTSITYASAIHYSLPYEIDLYKTLTFAPTNWINYDFSALRLSKNLLAGGKTVGGATTGSPGASEYANFGATRWDGTNWTDYVGIDYDFGPGVYPKVLSGAVVGTVSVPPPPTTVSLSYDSGTGVLTVTVDGTSSTVTLTSITVPPPP